jgi:hypothetical protein
MVGLALCRLACDPDGEQTMQEDNRIGGAVSLWVGVSPSRNRLEEYVEIDYCTTDKSHVSEFADEFGTGFYDEDFMELSFHEKPTRSLANLLHRCSYAALIIPKFTDLCGDILPAEANSAVLLYDFQHHGTPGAGGGNGPVRLRYMGSINVDMPWPD